MAARLRNLLRRFGYRGSRYPVILRYHRVTDLDPDPDGLAVSPRFFGEHLAVLGARYHPTTLQALVGGLRDGSGLPHGVVITFDDGYSDNLLEALPLLERHDIPATVFVTTGFVGSGGVFLTTEELLRLTDSELVEIGAHSATHPVLRGLTPARQWEEINGSKVFLERLLGRPVKSFAYPYGQSARTASLVQQAGFESACTTVTDVVVRGQDPYRLPRVYVGNWDGDQFARHLATLIRPHD